MRNDQSDPDQEVLTLLAVYRWISVRQLLFLQQHSGRTLRRRLRRLENEGLIQVVAGGLGHGPGRPGQCLSLTWAGRERLQAENILANGLPGEKSTVRSSRGMAHQLLLNEFCIQLIQIPQIVPTLGTRFLNPGGPRAGSAGAATIIHQQEIAWANEEGGSPGFTPDGVLCMTDKADGKTILFLLEVDMGTESLISHQQSGHDIRTKIVRYQAYFRNAQYQRMGTFLGTFLRGFRLLFVTATLPRLTRLCQLVRQMPPADFIWLTRRDLMLTEGIWAPIWTRGGRDGEPLQSILGRRTPQLSPRPADLGQTPLLSHR